jgi:hypothetical protein
MELLIKNQTTIMPVRVVVTQFSKEEEEEEEKEKENNNKKIIYDKNTIVWPDLQKCDPDVAVRYLNQHVEMLEREGKLDLPAPLKTQEKDGKLQTCGKLQTGDDDKKPGPMKESRAYFPKLSLGQLLGPYKKKASTVKAPRTKKATTFMARAVVHHRPGYYKPMSPSEVADHKMANDLHCQELFALKKAFSKQTVPGAASDKNR